jgi:hypothetical protein
MDELTEEFDMTDPTEAKVSYTEPSGWTGINSVEDVRQAVAMIGAMADDPEQAHLAEDVLYQHVLKQIAEGRPADPSAFAAEVLLADDLEFSRWYA